MESGMTSEMVRPALGIPNAISRWGDDERWGYAVMAGDIQIQEELLFSVHVRCSVVTRTAGDRDRLKTPFWRD